MLKGISLKNKKFPDRKVEEHKYGFKCMPHEFHKKPKRVRGTERRVNIHSLNNDADAIVAAYNIQAYKEGNCC